MSQARGGEGNGDGLLHTGALSSREAAIVRVRIGG